MIKLFFIIYNDIVISYYTEVDLIYLIYLYLLIMLMIYILSINYHFVIYYYCNIY